MRRNILLIGGAVILFYALPAITQAVDSADDKWILKTGGYYKNLLIYHEDEEFRENIWSSPENKKMVTDINRLRISSEAEYAGNFMLYADIDIESVSCNYRGSDEFNAAWRRREYNEPVKTEVTIADTSNHYATGDFRNVYAKGVMGHFTGTAGRQQIRFGNSRLWNPLDLMNPFSPLSIEGVDEQRGTDSLRVDWYLGESTEVTGVTAPKLEDDSYDDLEAENFNSLVRFKSGGKVSDYAFIYGYTSKRINAGGDFAAELYDGLLTGVVLYSKPEKGKSYYQCGTGYEYTLSSGLYILAEYFYNSLPVNEDDELAAALLHFYTSGIDDSNYYIISNRMITYNSHYMSVSAGYDFHPLLRGDLFTAYDFQGEALFINASLKLNAAENLDLTAGVITALAGDSPVVSDFDPYDNEPEYYGSLQFYF